MRTFCLVACVAAKLNHEAQAKEMYQSPWFKKARNYAEKNCGGWAILSAKHGLIYPWERIEPYDATLNNLTANQRRAWATQVLTDLAKTDWEHIEILAGHKYREHIEAWLTKKCWSYSVPMRGLGIGQQLRWLSDV
jgi:hypothetical protein